MIRAYEFPYAVTSTARRRTEAVSVCPTAEQSLQPLHFCELGKAPKCESGLHTETIRQSNQFSGRRQSCQAKLQDRQARLKRSTVRSKGKRWEM